MWQLYSHMVGPAAVILGFTVTTLWYFKASAPIEMKILCAGKKKRKKEEILQNRRRHRQWRMRIQSCLSRPLRSMWLFFNAFTPASFFSPSIYSTWTKGLLVFIHPSPPTPPLSDHFILHPNPCWLLCTLSPSPPPAYVPPSPSPACPLVFW